MSTISETIYTLEQFNKWRRGNKTITAPDSFEVGVAIGDAVRLLRELFAVTARAEKAEASLHNLNLDLSTANHMIKLERDRADALQTRLNEIDAMLNSPETF
jgi:predicted nuclease with TOPRIM domain